MGQNMHQLSWDLVSPAISTSSTLTTMLECLIVPSDVIMQVTKDLHWEHRTRAVRHKSGIERDRRWSVLLDYCSYWARPCKVLCRNAHHHTCGPILLPVLSFFLRYERCTLHFVNWLGISIRHKQRLPTSQASVSFSCTVHCRTRWRSTSNKSQNWVRSYSPCKQKMKPWKSETDF